MKRLHFQVAAIGLLAAALLSANIGRAQEPTNPAAAVLKSHIMVTPKEMKWGECPPAIPSGAQCAVVEGDPKAPNALFAFRIKLPDNFRVPPHFHPADEHLVVISGVFNMGLGDKLDTGATRPLTAGSFMVMPKGTRHYLWTKGETIIHVYAIGPWGLTYVNPKDDPRKKKQ